ncbi:L,D-transpeptidase family protein [Azohydromonas sp.]|uniref:L,D-transpeptidase family protein n=1 Tax=Azohydromonas sp. TaxID=1872666 RepID=UPI002C9C32B4|nr:L,D-transpeptidase family protein [Azohydromonas sp.]HMM84304.1 L,D-transpeptidase family protein [Azohydromonas sp.]
MRCSCAGVERRTATAWIVLAAWWLAAALAAAAARADPLPRAVLWSVDAEHVAVAGDSLTRVAARHGVGVALLARDNALSPQARLRPGQALRVRSHHLLPQPLADGVGDDGIVINAAQRMLWLRRGGELVAAYPVTVGRPDWATPRGAFRVVSREKDKTWIVPPSIQQEMREQGKPVLTRVPPGPDNPLGGWWIGTSLPGIGIHGTNAPGSIYGFRSHGCVRMHSDDAAALFGRVAVGDTGRIAYEPVILVQTDDGAIWFEANPDPYRAGTTTLRTLRERAERAGVAARVDWPLVEAQWRQRDGQARPVHLPWPAGGQSAGS